ncbi:hypothetical protein D3C86_2005220 [compost metagenome]
MKKNFKLLLLRLLKSYRHWSKLFLGVPFRRMNKIHLIVRLSIPKNMDQKFVFQKATYCTNLDKTYGLENFLQFLG